jgi:hypothetical protein
MIIRWHYLISVIGMFFLCSSFTIADDSQYKKDYKIGMQHYKNRLYGQADVALRNSFAQKNDARTAYFISDSNFEIDQFVVAKKYALLALNELEPDIGHDKKDYLKKMILRIDQEAKDNYIRIRSMTRILLTHSANGPVVKDLAKLAGLKKQQLEKIQIAKALLLSLDINPEDVYESNTPDKCTGSVRNLSPEDIQKCLQTYIH